MTQTVLVEGPHATLLVLSRTLPFKGPHETLLVLPFVNAHLDEVSFYSSGVAFRNIQSNIDINLSDTDNQRIFMNFYASLFLSVTDFTFSK